MRDSVTIEHVIRSRTHTRSVRASEGSGSRRTRLFPGKRITEREKSEFCTQLSVMLKSKISLHRSLQALGLQARNPRLKEVIDSLSNEIQSGNSFSKALSSQKDVFDNLFVMTAEVGQESGRLPEVLSSLSIHLEKVNNLKRKFRQALTYPAFVLSVAVSAVLFLLLFIVPTFAELFKSFQMELPPATKIVLGVSRMVTDYGIYVLTALVTTILVVWKGINITAVRNRAEELAIKIPYVGDVLLKNHIARFCRTLGTLLQAQVSLLDALEVSKRILSNRNMRDDVDVIIHQVQQGSAVSEPLTGSRFFPPMVAQMIAVGEETSELDEMLLKVSDYYEKEIDVKVETLSSVIEPVLILVLSIIVAAILASMYLPMFDLVNVVGGG